jgi:hypothetical protein
MIGAAAGAAGTILLLLWFSRPRPEAVAPSTPVSPVAGPSEATPSPPKALTESQLNPHEMAGFASLPWGSSTATIQKKFGQPVVRQPLEKSGGGGEILQFKTRLLDKEVTMVLLIHAEKGLIKAGYIYKLQPGDNCELVFSNFRDAVALQYPGITPDDTSFNKSSISFCDGLTIGKAGKVSTWWDSVTGTKVLLSLEAGQQDVKLWYESREFGAYMLG